MFSVELAEGNTTDASLQPATSIDPEPADRASPSGASREFESEDKNKDNNRTTASIAGTPEQLQSQIVQVEDESIATSTHTNRARSTDGNTEPWLTETVSPTLSPALRHKTMLAVSTPPSQANTGSSSTGGNTIFSVPQSQAQTRSTMTDASIHVKLEEKTSLQQLRPLRMAALDKRIAIKEERKRMKNRNSGLALDLHNFKAAASAIKEKAPKEIAEEFSDLDYCIVNIEDRVAERDNADVEFGRSQDQLIDFEWRLKLGEDALYGDYDGPSEIFPPNDQALNAKQIDRGDAAAVDVVDFNRDLAIPVAAAPQIRIIEPPPPEDDEEALPGSALLDAQVQEEDDGLLEEPELLTLTAEEGVADYGPHNFDQFIDDDIPSIIERARAEHLNIEPDYNKSDMDRLLRWLAYGRPWSDLLGSPQPATPRENPLPARMLTMIRTWLVHALTLSNLPSNDPDAGEPGDMRLFAQLRKMWNQDLFWDPWMRGSRPIKNAVTVGMAEERQQQHLPVKAESTTPITTSRDFDDYRADSVTMALTNTTNVAQHRRYAQFEPPITAPLTEALSERSQIVTGRKEWSPDEKKHRRGQSLPDNLPAQSFDVALRPRRSQVFSSWS